MDLHFLKFRAYEKFTRNFCWFVSSKSGVYLNEWDVTLEVGVGDIGGLFRGFKFVKAAVNVLRVLQNPVFLFPMFYSDCQLWWNIISFYFPKCVLFLFLHSKKIYVCTSFFFFNHGCHRSIWEKSKTKNKPQTNVWAELMLSWGLAVIYYLATRYLPWWHSVLFMTITVHLILEDNLYIKNKLQNPSELLHVDIF